MKTKILLFFLVLVIYSCSVDIESNKIDLGNVISLKYQDIELSANNMFFYYYGLDTNIRYQGVSCIDFKNDFANIRFGILNQGLFPLYMTDKYFAHTYVHSPQYKDDRFCIYSIENSKKIWQSDSLRPFSIIGDNCYLENDDHYYLLDLKDFSVDDFGFKGQIDKVFKVVDNSDEILFISKNILGKLDVFDGNIIWKNEVELQHGEYINKVIVSESFILIFSSNNEVLSYGSEGQLKLQINYDKPINYNDISENNIYKDFLYIRNGNTISLIDLKTGDVNYNILNSDVYVAGGHVYIHNHFAYFITFNEGFYLTRMSLEDHKTNSFPIKSTIPISRIRLHGRTNNLILDYMNELDENTEYNKNIVKYIKTSDLLENGVIRL